MTAFTGLLIICVCSAAGVSADQGAEEKQKKVIELVSRLGTDDVHQHEPHPFPFTDPSLYTNNEIVEEFIQYYNEGYLVKDGVFQAYDFRTKRDTDALANLLYYAKDFDTFYQISSWAKHEINPVQFVHGLYRAVLHREDTSSLLLPPLYEVLPNFFVPSSIVNAAFRAKISGVESREFVNNNTGWDVNWYHSLGLYPGHLVDPLHRAPFHDESTLSYYREDVSRSDFFFKYFLKLSNKGREENTSKERIGEWYYTAFKWILTRYNLERYAVGLPPAQPLQFKDYIKSGYDSQLVDLYGHHVASRADDVRPFDLNQEGSIALEHMFGRILNDPQSNIFASNSNDRDLRQLFNSLGENMTVGADRSGSSLFINLMTLVDGLSASSNNAKNWQGVLLNDLTRMRDPAYYQALARIDMIYRIMEMNLKPYSQDELSFPGVQINNVELSNLETYFEYFNFDMSNAVPGNRGNYTVWQFRINHRPFTVKMNIHSDAEKAAVVKMFLAPKYDHLNRTLALNQLRESFTLIDTFTTILKEGVNRVERNPADNELASSSMKSNRISELQNAPNAQQNQCYYPSHLLLPKGSSAGTAFKLYIMVYPQEATVGQGVSRTCGRDHLTLDEKRSLAFPVDRFWRPSNIDQPNHKFMDVLIYHNQDH